MLSLKNVGQLSLDRVMKDKDLGIGITAPEGDGKSCVGIGLGMAIDPQFDMKRNVLFSPTVKEIRDKIYNLPSYTPIVADEAIKIMYKLNWGSKIQKYLNRIYAVCRDQNKISIFNIPRFTDFSEYFRNHRIRLWIHIVDPINNEKPTGHAVVIARSWNPVSLDPWGLKIFEKKMEEERRRGKRDVYFNVDEKIGAFESLPGFLDVLKFSWVDSKKWDEYLAIKAIANAEEGDEFDDDVSVKELEQWKTRAILAIKIFKGMNYSSSAIAKVFNTHPNSVASWIKSYDRDQSINKTNRPKSS